MAYTSSMQNVLSFEVDHFESKTFWLLPVFQPFWKCSKVRSVWFCNHLCLLQTFYQPKCRPEWQWLILSAGHYDLMDITYWQNLHRTLQICILNTGAFWVLKCSSLNPIWYYHPHFGIATHFINNYSHESS